MGHGAGTENCGALPRGATMQNRTRLVAAGRTMEMATATMHGVAPSPIMSSLPLLKWGHTHD